MEAHALQALEYDRVRKILSQFAASELGREAAEELMVKADIEVLKRELDEVSEMKGLLAEGSDPLFDGAENLALLLDSPPEGGCLTPQQLLSFSRTLRCAGSVRKSLQARKKSTPRLALLASSLDPLPLIEEKISGSIDESGDIVDSASEVLHSLRSERKMSQERVRETLSSMIEEKGDALQEPFITIRDDRYVIPVKTGERAKIGGVVHDVSSTGATLFIEPLAVVELNNQIKRLSLEEREEERRILRGLTDLVRGEGESLRETLRTLKTLDLIYAKARFSREFDCHPPSLNNGGYLRLKGGRHPLLMARKGETQVVPLDLELGRGYSTLLISGPNSGGKTVALKTVGLLTLMVQSGMHIPASPDSELGVFQQIFADIGDEQSIEEGLSSFSSHLQAVKKVLSSATRESIVFLDEIGGSTDPEEGSCLAMAILSELTHRDIKTLATTHYGKLKVFVSSRDGMENGGMEFDSQTNLPTYRLKIGLPGMSNALQIAQGLGMPEEILKKARDFLDPEGLKVDALIGELEESRQAVEKERSLLAGEREELERLVEEHGKRLEELKQTERERKARAKTEARRIVEETRAICENLVRQIRESQASRESIKRFRNELEEQLSQLSQPEPSKRIEELSVGDTVFVESLNLRGTLLSLTEESGRVEVGGVRVEVPLGGLRRAESAEPPSYGVKFTKDRDVSPSLDVRGMRVEEAKRALEKYLDDIKIAGLSVCRVIHGKGTGALKSLVEETLRAEKGIKSFRPEGVNQGVTIVEFEGCENSSL